MRRSSGRGSFARRVPGKRGDGGDPTRIAHLSVAGPGLPRSDDQRHPPRLRRAAQDRRRKNELCNVSRHCSPAVCGRVSVTASK